MTLTETLPILQAIANGEPWQYKLHTNWHDASATDDPLSCIIRMCDFRLKPQAYKPEKWAAEKAAFAEGKKIEWRANSRCRWYRSDDPRWSNCSEYRIAPSPTYIPLGPGDVPPGTVLRGAGEIGSLGWCLITSCSETGIRLWRHCDPDYQQEITWDRLLECGSQILRPNTTVWEECRKESK